MKLEAKVATVLSPFEIAINVGTSDGVSEGCRVEAWTDTQVVDPDTGEPLGTVRLSKLKFDVRRAEPAFSVAVVISDSVGWAASTIWSSFGKQKRMVARGRDEDDPVSVKVGESVTVYLPELPVADAEEAE
jgi:hypothetical protein